MIVLGHGTVYSVCSYLLQISAESGHQSSKTRCQIVHRVERIRPGHSTSGGGRLGVSLMKIWQFERPMSRLNLRVSARRKAEGAVALY